MKRILISLIAISSILYTGCQSSGSKSKTAKTPKNDSIRVITRHFHDDPNAPVEWKIPMKKDKDGKFVRNGTAVRYTKSGKIAEKIPYVNGKKEGIRLKYHSTRKVYKEQPYKDGKLNGICKRYDRQGKLTAEYPYKGGMPGTGLTEYTNLGKKRTDPVITVVKKDELRTSHRYRLILSLTGKGADRIKSVEFYHGQLIEGKYFHNNLQPAARISVKKGEIDFKVSRGTVINKTINIVAVAKTYSGLTLILQKPVKVSFRGI